jgi:hypothetical protein
MSRTLRPSIGITLNRFPSAETLHRLMSSTFAEQILAEQKGSGDYLVGTRMNGDAIALLLEEGLRRGLLLELRSYGMAGWQWSDAEGMPRCACCGEYVCTLCSKDSEKPVTHPRDVIFAHAGAKDPLGVGP